MISTGSARRYAPSFICIFLFFALIAAQVRPPNPRAFAPRPMTWAGCLLTLAPNLDVWASEGWFVPPFRVRIAFRGSRRLGGDRNRRTSGAMLSAPFIPTFAHSFVYSNGKPADGPVALTSVQVKQMETYQSCAAAINAAYGRLERGLMHALSRLTDLTATRARSLTLADLELVMERLDAPIELRTAVELLRDPETRLLAHGYCQTEECPDRNLRFILSADGHRHEFSEQDLVRIAGSAPRKLAAALHAL
ncbi:hypothetical protein LZ016_01880 [Sphingomonas sp. SM33]|uniref:Uncharacterized protein n=1 Tax=Sphingomonas telluris TaxID=2907998 RepID=A0ABS9VIR3_9SPHN|nr:hypothetical protein [Sphingomonas telluris]MCH8614856.1 hypothetical protein [Sphingomonas telluris]